MNRILPICILVLACIQASFAQHLLSNPTSLSFANRTTGTLDSLKVSLNFQTGNTKTVTIRNIVSLNKAFQVKDTSFIMQANSSKDVWVYFNPVHNINYLSYLVVLNNSHTPQVVIQVKGTGVYAETYYAATQNLSEQALKDALKTILSTGQASCTYNGSRDQMFMTIDNKKTNGQGAATNTLECVYTGREAVGYVSRSAAQTNDNFNTEHTWPQSLFSSAAPMVCDLHHLFPTDEVANGTRSNYPFGMVTSPTWAVGGSKYAGGIFEPRDFHKGHVARAMMYFVLRYQDYSNFFAPQENILRKWHNQFGPTSLDTKRNNDIFAFQGNRNPFIDHPEILDRITLLAGTSVAPLRKTAYSDLAAVVYYVSTKDSNASYTIPLVNTGNTSLTYTASFAQQQLMLTSSVTGNLNQDSTLYFTFRNSAGDTTAVIRDTLIVLTNTTNAAQLRIPVEFNIEGSVGIPEKTLPAFTFQCSPNPSNQELSISSHNAECFDIRIVNLQGQTIWEHHQQTSYLINTSTFTNGLYFVIGNTPAQSFRTKIYIQH